MRRVRVHVMAAMGAVSALALLSLPSCGDDETEAVASPSASDASTAEDVTISDGASPLIEAASDVALEAASASRMELSLDREPLDGGPFAVVVEVRATDAVGAPLVGGAFSLEAPVGTVLDATEVGGGVYRGHVAPSFASGELPIVARLSKGNVALERTRTAIIAPTVGAAFMLPEAVEGMVNTPAYEDGVVISPDGQWLFVNSYSPVDAICCLIGCDGAVDPFGPLCQTVLGPYAAPARPNMFGADRIVSSTRVLNRCDKLCLSEPDGGELQAFALPPVAAFGFKRQPDGSFAEPFAFGIDADGCAAPFGASFVSAPSANAAEIVFSGTFPGGADNDLYWAPLNLGVPNVFARYQCVAGTTVASDVTMQKLPISSTTAHQGNPQVGGGYIFFDDEFSSDPPKMLLAKMTGALPDASFAAAVDLPAGGPGTDRRHPPLRGSTLYYADQLRLATAELSGDPALVASWSAPTIQLAAEATTRVGAVIAVGQPTVAKLPNGTEELYFVYGVKTATGLDLNAGRMRKR